MLRGCAHSLSIAPGFAEIVEGQLPAIGDLAVGEQTGAQQGLVPAQFRRVHPRRLEGAVPPLHLRDPVAFRRELGFDDLGAGGAQARDGIFEDSPALRQGAVPMRRMAQRQPRRPVRHCRRLIGDRH